MSFEMVLQLCREIRGYYYASTRPYGEITQSTQWKYLEIDESGKLQLNLLGLLETPTPWNSNLATIPNHSSDD